MENDIPKSKILDIEYFEMEIKISEKNKEEPKYNTFDRLVNQLCKEMPIGSTYDKTHILLTNAFMFSFGCGWLSQSMINDKEPKFKEEYLEQFGRAITKAYDLGRNGSNRTKTGKN